LKWGITPFPEGPPARACIGEKALGAPKLVQMVWMMMIVTVYWYLFSHGNHYTRECIHTGERERNVTSLNSPRALYQPPPHGVGMHHARHITSSPCVVSSQAGFGMQRYLPPHARWPQCVYRGRVQAAQADPVCPWSTGSLLVPSPPLDYIENLYIHIWFPHLTT
jgi:hypothetical protein